MATKIEKSDGQIQRDVLDELTWDTRVEPTEVGVEVTHGVVTLTGRVSSWAKKLAAQEAAHRVAGVLDVANDLEIELPDGANRSDTAIAEAVRHALEWDVFVPHENIQSTVSNGIVSLTGIVDTHAEREDAGRAIRNLAGVRAVANCISLRQIDVTPDQVRTAIHDALERHADRDAARLKIDVTGGEVTLMGKVHTRRDHDAIVGAVTGTRGVESVVDRIRIA